MSNDLMKIKGELLGSLLVFTRVFFKLRTGKEFVISQPVSAESHFITICREFTKLFHLETKNLLINCPPGWAKSELCKHFIAWAFAHYPDAQFMYISYGHELAAKHTHGIKQIIEIPDYKELFGISIASDSSAKNNFKTNHGGTVRAFGLNSGITGHDAGLPHLDRFSGAAIIDDAHRPKDVHSDTMREQVINNYSETVLPRIRGTNVPMAFIGQRLHEDDLAQFIINDKDGRQWKKLILEARDTHGNPLYPEIHSRSFLENEEKNNEYVFSAQYMQKPQPSGGGIFKPEWFVLLDEEPRMLSTFITIDTAETDKDYNDATVFSFWGIYKIKDNEVETDTIGLHWINCLELRVEPKDLEPEFRHFYTSCMLNKVKPNYCAIEKRSTGSTLLSLLKDFRGMRIVDISRTRASGSKTTRFLEIQPIIASKLISFRRYDKHVDTCIEHLRKITANNTHRFDDIADTLYDACKIALIDKTLNNYSDSHNTDKIVKDLSNHFSHISRVRQNHEWRRP